MNKNAKRLGIMMLIGFMLLSSSAFADEDAYHHRNFFNHFTDWCVTIGKAPDDRQRIVNERVEARAQWRHGHDHNDHHDRS